MKRIHNIIDNINNTIMGIQLIGDKKIITIMILVMIYAIRILVM